MSMFNKVTKTFQWGPHSVTLETGEIARQSGGAVLVNIDDTVVLATVVARKRSQAGPGLLPADRRLHREDLCRGQDSRQLLQARRPPERTRDADQPPDRPADPPAVPRWLLQRSAGRRPRAVSLNPEVQADIAALIGTSAALAISGIPFNGPIGAARVGYVNGEYVLNPGQTQLHDSQLNLVVAGTEAAVLMVESEADQLSEEIMLGAVVFGHEQGNVAIAAINELVRDAGKPEWDWQPPAKDEAFIAKVAALAEEPLRAAYQIRSKQARTQACREAYCRRRWPR